jgi:glycosyltransferase involved in cell wall biosynthesis
VRILYVIDTLAPGGAERSLAAMAPHLVSRGINLDVAYLKDRSGLQMELEAAGAHLFNLDGQGGRLRRIGRAVRLARARRPDLIHTTLFEADIAGRTAGWRAHIPSVSSLVGEPYGPEHFENPERFGWKVRGAQFCDSLTAQMVARFHAITAHVADVMAGRLHIRRDRIDVVPRGRDPKDLGSRSIGRAASVRYNLGVPADAPLIMAAASHEHRKGLDRLLAAFPNVLRSIPHAHLVIAGREGQISSTLRRMTTDLGLEGVVRLLGERSDVPDLLSAADVFVLPSRSEGMGSVLLEAMALEAPIVASDLPAVREVLPESMGRLVWTGDPVLLGHALIEVLLDGDAAKERAAQARRRFLRYYTIDRVVDQMIEFYERVLATRSKADLGDP